MHQLTCKAAGRVECTLSVLHFWPAWIMTCNGRGYQQAVASRLHAVTCDDNVHMHQLACKAVWSGLVGTLCLTGTDSDERGSAGAHHAAGVSVCDGGGARTTHAKGYACLDVGELAERLWAITYIRTYTCYKTASTYRHASGTMGASQLVMVMVGPPVPACPRDCLPACGVRRVALQPRDPAWQGNCDRCTGSRCRCGGRLAGKGRHTNHTQTLRRSCRPRVRAADNKRRPQWYSSVRCTV